MLINRYNCTFSIVRTRPAVIWLSYSTHWNAFIVLYSVVYCLTAEIVSVNRRRTHLECWILISCMITPHLRIMGTQADNSTVFYIYSFHHFTYINIYIRRYRFSFTLFMLDSSLPVLCSFAHRICHVLICTPRTPGFQQGYYFWPGKKMSLY